MAKVKRGLSILLAVILTVSLTSIGILAEEEDEGSLPVCTCTEKCTESSVNSACAYCSAVDADLAECLGTEEPEDEGVTVSFMVKMPDGSKQEVETSFAKNDGDQYIDFVDAMTAAGLEWESNYYISSAGVSAQHAELVYGGPSKIFELVTGFNVTVGETNLAKVANIVVQTDSRIQYYVYNYAETVDGQWALNNYERYTAVDPSYFEDATGWGPVIGSAYTIEPQEIDGYRYGAYMPVIQVYWTGFLNSGSYTDAFQQGNANFYTVSAGDLGLSCDQETGTLMGTAQRMEANFAPYVLYYYSLLRPVRYDANGGTGTMAAEPYIKGETVTISANGFANSGYTFTGWNTKADGTEDSYRPGDTFEMGAVEGVTLYAQWSPSGSSPSYSYYRVTVNYLDEASGSKIADQYVTASMIEGSRYDVSAYDAIAIEGYTYSRTSGDAVAGSLNGNKVVNVYYVPNSTEIEGEETPLSPTPPEESEPPVIIDDENVPLDSSPKTGDNMPSALLALALLGSLTGLIGVNLHGKKKESTDKQ